MLLADFLSIFYKKHPRKAAQDDSLKRGNEELQNPIVLALL